MFFAIHRKQINTKTNQRSKKTDKRNGTTNTNRKKQKNTKRRTN